jgi:hypothetical protein
MMAMIWCMEIEEVINNYYNETLCNSIKTSMHRCKGEVWNDMSKRNDSYT